MLTINHNQAIELEYQVRRLYKCDRSGISGLAEADYFGHKPIQAAVFIIAYIYEHKLETGPYQYDEFLYKYENIFDNPEDNDIAKEVCNYIKDLSSIVDQYIN